MPVDFLSDASWRGTARYGDPPARAELETVFFLDDEDKALIGRHRSAGDRLGFVISS